MKPSYSIAAVTAVLFASLADASIPNARTSSQCFTERCTSSVLSVPTSSKDYTITLPYFGVLTVTPVTTVTPATSTTTSTITDTASVTLTLPQVTDTFSLTLTYSESTTTTLNTVTITDSTSTTSTSTFVISGTTTIPTSSGFIPAISSLPGAAAKKRREVKQRSGNLLRPGSRSSQSQIGSTCPSIIEFNKNHELPISYPSSVTCNVVITVFVPIILTVTARTTSTTTAPTPIYTVFTTITTTTTSTIEPIDASTTLTQSTTTTFVLTESPSTTVTSTSTILAVVSTYTATYYAACASPTNIVGNVNGEGVNQPNFGSLSISNTADTSAYDCCVSCIINPSCAFTAYYGGFPAGSMCSLGVSTDSTCSEGEYSATANLASAVGADNGYLISNGNCGVYANSILQF